MRAINVLPPTPSYRRWLRLRDEYLSAIDPYVKLKVSAMNRCLTKITLFSDGHIEREYTEDGQRIMAECDKAIQSTGEAFRSQIGHSGDASS
jgi:hypothetical protein